MTKRKSVLYALFAVLLWGSLYPAVKLGYLTYHITTTGDILLFAGIRFTVCGALICGYSLVTDRASYRNIRASIRPVLLSGFFAIILNYGFSYMGLKFTDSSKTAILKQLGALCYVCFSFLFFKEDRLTVRKFVAAVMGFLGIIAINANPNGIQFNIGDAFIIAASFCTVFSNVISKKVLTKVSPVSMTGVSQLFGGAVLLLIGLALGGRLVFDIRTSCILLYICLATIFSYCIWFTVLKSGELSNLFIIKFAEPMFACLFGALVLDENIWKIQYLIAFLLIAGGIILSNRPHKAGRIPS